jgi:hypothetical protein
MRTRRDSLSQSIRAFLAGETRQIPWASGGTTSGLRPIRLLLGNGADPLEIAVAEAEGKPSDSAVRRLWLRRRRARPAPVLLVVVYWDREPLTALCGPSGERPPIRRLPLTLVERLCAAALAEPDRHHAVRSLEDRLEGLESGVVHGLVNRGLFANHDLRTGVPKREDWPAAQRRSTEYL